MFKVQDEIQFMMTCTMLLGNPMAIIELRINAHYS